MQVEPVGSKILIKFEKSTEKKVHGKTLYIVDKEDVFTRIVLVAKGNNVALAAEEGDELLLFSNAFVNKIPGKPHYYVVAENDIWGIINRKAKQR